MTRRFAMTLNWRSLAMLLACTTVLLLGCRNEETREAERQANATPEAKFARFEADLQRRCRESSGALVADNTGGLGTTRVSTIIDPPNCVLHVPQSPGGNYTAEVSLVTRLLYASSTPIETPAESRSKLKAPGQKQSQPLEEDEEEVSAEPTEDSPQRKLGRQEEFRDTYDLVYCDERWQLTSRDVPESMQLLLNRALDAQ